MNAIVELVCVLDFLQHFTILVSANGFSDAKRRQNKNDMVAAVCALKSCETLPNSLKASENENINKLSGHIEKGCGRSRDYKLKTVVNGK